MENEYEFTTTVDGLKVHVNKVGGGTVGREYAGEDWSVTVMNGDVFELDNAVLYIGLSTTHAQAAKLAAEWASDAMGEGV